MAPFDRSHTTSCRSATVTIAQSCNILTLNKGVILKDYSRSLEITRFDRRHSTQYIITTVYDPISCHSEIKRYRDIGRKLLYFHTPPAFTPIYVHDILKMNEPTSMQIGTSGARDKGMKRSILGR